MRAGVTEQSQEARPDPWQHLRGSHRREAGPRKPGRRGQGSCEVGVQTVGCRPGSREPGGASSEELRGSALYPLSLVPEPEMGHALALFSSPNANLAALEEGGALAGELGFRGPELAELTCPDPPGPVGAPVGRASSAFLPTVALTTGPWHNVGALQMCTRARC